MSLPNTIEPVGGWAAMRPLSSPIRRPIVSEPNDTLAKKVNDFAQNRFNELKDHQSEIVQGLYTGRVFLKTIDHLPTFEGDLQVAIGTLGMVSVVELASCPFRVYETGKEIVESSRLGDNEGMGLGVVGFVESLAGGLDSLVILNYSLADLIHAFTVAEPFQSMLLPLGMGLTAIDMGTRSFKMFRTNQLLKEIEAYEKGRQSEEEFREKILNISKPNLSEESKLRGDENDKMNGDLTDVKKERKLFRITSNKVVKCLKSLQNGDRQKIQDIKTYAQRKMRAGFASLTTSVVTLIALSLLLTAVSPYIPLAILTVLFIIKIGIFAYENYQIYNGLTSFSEEKSEKTNPDNVEESLENHSIELTPTIEEKQKLIDLFEDKRLVYSASN